jgi:hypothetical protein
VGVRKSIEGQEGYRGSGRVSFQHKPQPHPVVLEVAGCAVRPHADLTNPTCVTMQSRSSTSRLMVPPPSGPKPLPQALARLPPPKKTPTYSSHLLDNVQQVLHPPLDGAPKCATIQPICTPHSPPPPPHTKLKTYQRAPQHAPLPITFAPA